jgi:SAM-dependent methyltransferase
MLPADTITTLPRKVLNVGGGSKAIAIPPHYQGWVHHLLDIDARGEPDVVCDARELVSLTPGIYDAVYCSHNLEHYFTHDVPKVLKGFHHVLKDDGFAEIRVPDLAALMHAVVEKNLDLEDVLYQSPAGPIMVRDVIYGYGVEIERSGNDFYAHKTGFSPKSLIRIIGVCGFAPVLYGRGAFEVMAFAFKREPTEQQLALLGIAKGSNVPRNK